MSIRETAHIGDTVVDILSKSVGKCCLIIFTRAGQQWRGDARTAFDREFQKDVQKFEQFIKGIMDFIRVLRQNADEYDRVENTNTSIARVRKS